MPSTHDIVTFHDPPVPEGRSPYVGDAGPSPDVDVVESKAIWPDQFRHLEARIRRALGWRVLELEHVGSTAVPMLPAKAIIDIDLVIADPNDELAYVPALLDEGFELRIREPWWFGHRVLRHGEPACHLHVFGYDSPETVKHRIFRDWLRANADDRDLYAAAKQKAAAEARSSGEHSMQYNARKQEVMREIYHRAFVATGLLDQ